MKLLYNESKRNVKEMKSRNIKKYRSIVLDKFSITSKNFWLRQRWIDLRAGSYIIAPVNINFLILIYPY